MKFRAALANNDWMVDYGDVIIVSDEKGANSMAFRSMVSMAGDKQKQKSVERGGEGGRFDISLLQGRGSQPGQVEQP